MKQANEESQKSLEQGYEVLTDKPTQVQPKQNARLNGEKLCDDEYNEMDD